ncbi:hypothetical protein WMY93_031986, partial [Mugilogobius chulae]
SRQRTDHQSKKLSLYGSRPNQVRRLAQGGVSLGVLCSSSPLTVLVLSDSSCSPLTVPGSFGSSPTEQNVSDRARVHGGPQRSSVSWVNNKSSKKNVLELKTRQGCEYLIQYDTDSIISDWFKVINEAIRQLETDAAVSEDSDDSDQERSRRSCEFSLALLVLQQPVGGLREEWAELRASGRSLERVGGALLVVQIQSKDEFDTNCDDSSRDDRLCRASRRKDIYERQTQRRPTLQSVKEKGYIRETNTETTDSAERQGERIHTRYKYYKYYEYCKYYCTHTHMYKYYKYYCYTPKPRDKHRDARLCRASKRKDSILLKS